MACGVRRPAVRSLIGALGVLVVALMLVATLASPAAAQPRKHALLIGIGEYEYAGALDGPRHDVGALARALEQDWGFQDIRTLVDLLDRPVFAIARGVRPVTSERPSSLRLLLGEGAEDLRDRLSRLDGVTLVRGEHDVRVDAAGAGYTLRHGSGDSLAERLSAGDVAIRLERHRFVYELLGVRFPAAVFNVYLELAEMRDGLPGPMTRSELVRGTKYAFNYEADVAAYFLLVSADRDGRLSLLAPWDASDLQPQLSRLIPDIVVTGNPGTEFVKLFGFSRRPEGLEAWMPSADANGRLLVRHIEPDSGQLDELLRFVRAASGFAAETVVKLVSIEP